MSFKPNFQLLKVVKPLDTHKITGITVWKDKAIYVGTQEGTVSKYTLALQRVSKVSSQQLTTTCTQERGTSVGSSPVTNLVLLDSLHILAVLCDGKITLLKMKNLKHISTLRIPYGVQGFTCQYYATDQSFGNVDPSAVRTNRLCFYIKQNLYLYDLDVGSINKEFILPELPLDLVWVQDYIIAGFSRECSIIDTKNGKVDQLLHQNTAITKLLPSAEVVLGSPGTVHCIIRDLYNKSVLNQGIKWSKLPKFFGYIFPFLVIVSERSIQICNRFSEQEQDIAFTDVTFVCDTGQSIFLVNKDNEIYALAQTSLSLQIEDRTMFERILEFPMDEQYLQQFCSKTFNVPENPFTKLLDFYLQKILDKYNTLLSVTDLKTVDKALKTKLKPEVEHFSVAVSRTLVHFLTCNITDQAAIELLEGITLSTVYERFVTKLSTTLLLPLYRKIHEMEDKVYERNLNKLRNAKTTDLGIRRKYELTLNSLKKSSNAPAPIPEKLALPPLFAATLTTVESLEGAKITTLAVKILIRLDEIEISNANDLTQPIQSVKVDRLHYNKAKFSAMFSSADSGTIAKPLVSFLQFPDAEKFASFRSELRKGPFPEKPIGLPTATAQDANVSRDTISLDDADIERMTFFLQPDYIPYKSAIDQLQKLSKVDSMSAKLECMLATIQETVQCVKEFWQLANTKKDVLVGADDLVPLLSWVVLKARVPNLPSTLNCLLDMVDERTLSGQLGYSLCTMKASLMALESAPGAEKTPPSNPMPPKIEPSLSKSFDQKSTDPHVLRFRLPSSETRITHYSCSYLYATGTLHIFTSYICFEPLLIFPMDYVILSIPDIVVVKKASFAIMPTAVEISMANGDTYKFFNFVTNRNEVYQTILAQAKKKGAQLK